MKQILILVSFLFITINLLAQNKCNTDFEKLEIISKNQVVSNDDFSTAMLIVKNLESNNCSDYIINKNGIEAVEAGRTYLFGKICLKNNTLKAVKEYINYMQRHSGSAEEEISFSFERLFLNQPEDVLSVIGYNKDLLNQLEWGFVNNHYKLHLTPKNCRVIFYRVNPNVKSIYPKYKRQIDYLLNEIAAELKE